MRAYATRLLGAVVLLTPMWASGAPQEGDHVEENKALIRSYLAEMDRGHRDIIDDVYAPEVVLHYAGQEFTLAQMKEVAEEFYSAFPDLRHSIEDLVAEGDRVAVRLTDYATHEGEFQGIQASGREIAVEVFAIFRIQDGKIVELWELIDTPSLMQQISAPSTER